jgi:ADP-heptose:LPS heptosyltransferase
LNAATPADEAKLLNQGTPLNAATPADVSAPRLLFVPVSGAFGMGEYARSLAIAQGAARRWPAASIHFILSRAAPYAAHTPFPATLLPSSPTFHTAAVIACLHARRPDVVIFDNAGRSAQLRAARRAGARVVYISARPRHRAKAFRLRWMRLIDEHWIAYPEFIAGGLRFFERLKLRLLGRPSVRYLDVVLARAAAGAPNAQSPDGMPNAPSPESTVQAMGSVGAAQTPSPAGTAQTQGAAGAAVPGHEFEDAPILARLGCIADGYLLVVPGGGTGHPRASDAADRFLQAAQALAESGIETVFVGRADLAASRAAGSATPGSAAAATAAAGGASAGGAAAVGTTADGAAAVSAAVGAAAEGSAAVGAAAGGRLRLPGPLPQSELAALMRGARLIVANGGSTLLQAIACARPCIAVPIAGDQAARIRRCVAAGVALAAPLEAAAIVQLAADLWRNDAQRQALAERAAALGLADGVEVALNAVSALLAAA